MATYASRCIENEMSVFLRKSSRLRLEVSLDEPLKTDWDGNELLLSDVLATRPDTVSVDLGQGDRAGYPPGRAGAAQSPGGAASSCSASDSAAQRERTQKEVAEPAGHFPKLHFPAGKTHSEPSEHRIEANRLNLSAAGDASLAFVWYTEIRMTETEVVPW